LAIPYRTPPAEATTPGVRKRGKSGGMNAEKQRKQREEEGKDFEAQILQLPIVRTFSLSVLFSAFPLCFLCFSAFSSSFVFAAAPVKIRTSDRPTT
jgi:hypothetical protein